MKVEYIRSKDKKGRKAVTALIRNKKGVVVGHGKAVCSLEDEFNYEYGKSCAYKIAFEQWKGYDKPQCRKGHVKLKNISLTRADVVPAGTLVGYVTEQAY